MKVTDRFQRALNLAAEKHAGQMRKSSGYPYIVHPFSVVLVLSEYVHDEDVLIAGLLHDLLEDVDGYEYEDLEKDFGKRVADIVNGVSEDKDFDNGKTDRENWQERKDRYLKNLETDREESLLVCAADKIHNLNSMSKIFKKEGMRMWEDFNAPVERQIWYYGEVFQILKRRLQNNIVQELKESFNYFKITIEVDEQEFSEE